MYLFFLTFIAINN